MKRIKIHIFGSRRIFLFDEHTFYWTAFVFIISTFVFVCLLSRRVKIKNTDI